MSGRSIKQAIAKLSFSLPLQSGQMGRSGSITQAEPPVGAARVKATHSDIIGSDAALPHELLFERRHGPPLFRDLQHLLLNEWIARRLGEFVAFARLGVVLLGLAFRHRTIPDNLVGVAHKASPLPALRHGRDPLDRPTNRMRAPATLDQQMLSARRNLADRLSGRDRAARKTCPARDASRPAPASAVNERPRRVTGRVLGPSRQVCSQNLPDRTGGLR